MGIACIAESSRDGGTLVSSKIGLLKKIVIVSSISLELTVVDMKDLGCQSTDEVDIVGNKQQRAFVTF